MGMSITASVPAFPGNLLLSKSMVGARHPSVDGDVRGVHLRRAREL